MNDSITWDRKAVLDYFRHLTDEQLEEVWFYADSRFKRKRPIKEALDALTKEVDKAGLYDT